jgi:tRNA nucleotidyltransferase/poly(A) polymerase
VGDAQLRFEEDALRVLRALRFSANLNFKIEEKTIFALQKLAIHIESIPRERILREFEKSTHFYRFVKLILAHLPLSLFFSEPQNFHQKNYLLLRDKSSSPGKQLSSPGLTRGTTPFFHFIYVLSQYCHFEVKPSLLSDFTQWPLNKTDYFLCQFYTRLFEFEEFCHNKELTGEECEFLFYGQFLKVEKSYKDFTVFLFKQAAKIFHGDHLIKFVHLMTVNRFAFPNQDVSAKIIAAMQRNQVSPQFTQLCIDYFYFKNFQRQMMQENDIEIFVFDSICFLKKFSPYKKEWERFFL